MRRRLASTQSLLPHLIPYQVAARGGTKDVALLTQATGLLDVPYISPHLDDRTEQ